MLETYVDMFIFIIREIFGLITDDKITAFLGVNLLGAIVTGIIMMIVFKTLINPTAIGSMAVERGNIQTRKENALIKKQQEHISRQFSNVPNKSGSTKGN